ncbi:hypothetical protein FB451DRAFT_1267791 [Mycena latifolia]|nr:hypothetical protein FB451DRAFT_1267791 [Mycena latifolia]
MCSRKQEYAILICPAGLLVASVGWSLSVLATVFTALTSSYSGQPNIIVTAEIRDAAVTASTRSSPHFLREKSVSPTRRVRRPRPRELLVDVKRAAPDVERKAAPEVDSEAGAGTDVDESFSPLLVSSPVSDAHAPALHLVHFQSQSPAHDHAIPTIAISPPPPRSRLSLQSDTSSSHTLTSGTHTLSSVNTFSSGASSLSSTPERRGRHRLRFSSIVHLFMDKRASSKSKQLLDRRRSLPAIPLPPPSPPASEHRVPAPSPPASPTSPRSLSGTSKRSRRRRSLMLRVASCPILHHSHSQSHTFDTPATMEKAEPKPCSKKAPVEPKPRPRTQPYAAPYFILPPDSADVEEPFARRRRPERRRTMPPPERRLSSPSASAAEV